MLKTKILHQKEKLLNLKMRMRNLQKTLLQMLK